MMVPSISVTPAICVRESTTSSRSAARIPTPWMPLNGLITRWNFGTCAMLYRLRVRVDVRAIYLRERMAAGWGPA